MDKLTEFYLFILNSIGIYCFLTLPFLTYILFNFGIIYPMWLIMICSVTSPILSNFLTKWEKEMVEKRKRK